MKLVDLPIGQIREAPWNSNSMDTAMMARLRRSIDRFGMVVPLVVRSIGRNRYETIGGAQRLSVLKELDFKEAPVVVAKADDAEARLLAQALNHIEGEDDLGLRAEVLRTVLEQLTQEEVLSVLPESAESLKALVSLGQETIADHLQAWQKAQAARLKHLQFQLTSDQLAVVEQALHRFLPKVKEADSDSPNTRGTALFLLCKTYLKKAV